MTNCFLTYVHMIIYTDYVITKREEVNKMNDPAKLVYSMFAFQYKPLENKLLSNAPDFIKEKYNKLPTFKKIIVLDKYAAQLGL